MTSTPDYLRAFRTNHDRSPYYRAGQWTFRIFASVFLGIAGGLSTYILYEPFKTALGF